MFNKNFDFFHFDFTLINMLTFFRINMRHSYPQADFDKIGI